MKSPSNRRVARAAFQWSVASILVILLASFALSGCGGGDEAAEGETEGAATGEAPAGEPVKIGILTGLTGDYAPFQQVGLEAAEIGVQEVNAAGGVLGRPLELVVFDNGSTVEGSISGWSKLTELDKVVAVGNMESDSVVALIEEAAAAKVPINCPSCGAAQLDTRGGKYIYRLTGGDAEIGVALAQRALEDTKSIAILTQKGLEATEAISDIFIAAFEKGGGRVVADVRFDGGANTFQAELERAFDASDTVMLSAVLEPGLRLMNDWHRRGYGGKWFFIPDVLAPEMAEFGGGALEGRAFGISPTYDESNPAFQHFAPLYESETGNELSTAFYEPTFYDQILLYALAATAAGEATGEAIDSHMREVANPPGKVVYTYEEGVNELEAGNDIDFYGASGNVDLNEFGVVSGIYTTVAPEDGKWGPTGGIIEVDPALKP